MPRIEVDRVRSASPDDALIALGVVESAVADACCPVVDRHDAAARAFREALLLAAHGFPARAVDLLAPVPLPEEAEAGVPEGYAWYALYPGMYRAAARQFFERHRPETCGILGIRGIGTSLSAAVAATLEDLGVRTRSWTVRPRGHPFQRRLVLDRAFEAELCRESGAWFAVVDEGPGLSGTSITAAAEKLSELGIPNDRIVLFPSWNPDGSAFLSGAARERWRKHERYVAAFEEVFPEFAAMRDLSAGRWRTLFWPNERDWPAAQPQHERRKYLRADGALLKFAGIGPYGDAPSRRARSLAEAGFAPPVLGLDNGFLVTRFVEGHPAPRVCPELIDFMARYLAYLRLHSPGERTVGFDELLAMIRVNAGEACAAGLEPYRLMIEGEPVAAIDGRMLPHEFIDTAAGFLKADAAGHHDDHFYPGCQDIAWDVAAACIEFDLDPDILAPRYAALSGDRGITRRLPFYRTAWLAFRAGYARLAQDALAGTAEAARFAALEARYRGMLNP